MHQQSDVRIDSPLILVVDDEVLIWMLAVKMLHDAGFRAVEACNADEAIDLLAGVAYDLVFTDINMPGSIDGLGLTAYVQTIYPAVPVVLTSGGVPAHACWKAILPPFCPSHIPSGSLRT